MKKIGLFTIDPSIYNYGGLLQEYALFQVLSSLKYETEIVNYDVNSELNTFSYKRDIRYLTPQRILHRIKTKLVRDQQNGSTELNKASCILFDDFRKENLIFSDKYSRGNLKDSVEEYDGFVCGSDQIWNPAFNIPSFFLNFVTGNKTKAIYAASIGIPTLTKQQAKVYKKLLENLEWISVREKEGQALIQSLTDKNVELVLDPTLLLSKEEWLKSVDAAKVEWKEKSPYVFCYFLGKDSEKCEVARKFAKENGLQLIFVPFEGCPQPEDYKKGIGPNEFLALINGAEFVLTDSFHACVFSIIFDKQFRVFTRKAGSTNMNSRIRTLLDYISKGDFLISPAELENIELGKKSSYDKSKIELKKKQSIQWLQRALEEYEN